MKSKIFLALSLLMFGISFISAQQSCYEQYLRAHNMPLPTDSMVMDDSYDELKKEVIARQLMRNERTSVSQPIRQPIFLAIDTLAGTCHLLAQDGTILADVHLAMVDSTWYMWLSVDPLADKNIANTPYMYCNGNPIMFIDPDGMAAYYNDNGDFLGVDADGFIGRVYITDQETYSDLCDYNNVVGLPELQNSQLSAEAYSKIYTDILKQSDYGYSFDNVVGNAIAIYSMNGCYNDPQALRSSGVMSNTQRWVDNNHNVKKMKLMVNQNHADVTKYLNTVENIISFLGVHEYEGHGIFDYGDKDGTHDLAYLLQMQHPTWNSLTPDARLFIKKMYRFHLDKRNVK